MFDSLLYLGKDKDIEIFFSEALKNDVDFARAYGWISDAIRPYEFRPRKGWKFVGNGVTQIQDFGQFGHDPSLFEDHLQSASVRIDECLKRLEEIQRLQALATSSAIEFILAQGTDEPALNVAKLVVKANRKIALASAVDADEEDVIRQSEVQAKIRELSLRLHSVTGSPLNYSEIISKQKELLDLDIADAWDRLFFAAHGLKVSGIAEMPVLPSLKTKITDALHEMTMWARSAIHKFECRWEREDVHTAIVRVSEFYEGGKESLVGVLAGDLPIIEFELSTRAFPFHLGRHRIQKLSIAIEMNGDENEFNIAYSGTEEKSRSMFSLANSWHQGQLDKISFPMRTRLPSQPWYGQNEGTTFVAHWKKPDCWSSTEVKVWGGAPNALLSPSRFYRNADPLGKWRLDFVTQCNGPHGRVPLSFFAKKTGKNSPLWNISDIVIWMEIATVKNAAIGR